MPNDPLVSVIIPVHNGARYLRDAIQSALDQRYSALEIIVVDDGSTDDTAKVLQGFEGRITSIHQSNSGAAVARNRAIELAHGEFIAFLDADDLWLPDKLRVQVDYLLAHPDVDLVASRWHVLAADTDVASVGDSVAGAEATELDTRLSGWLYNELLIDCIVHTTTVVLRRRLIDAVGMFDPELKRGQDYDYWLRASRSTQIHSLTAKLSVYRLHPANSTWRPQTLNYGALVIERALDRWGRCGPDGRVSNLVSVRQRISNLWFSFGTQHMNRGSLPLAFRAGLRSLVAWPLHYKPWLLLVACAVAPLRRQN